jgi:steroid delta-isomerase-like uncharacterized protein
VHDKHNLVRRYFSELLNQASFADASDILTPDFAFYGPLAQDGAQAEGLKQFTLTLRAAFPNKHFTILEQFQTEAVIVARFKMTGTHKGFFQGIPPTGKSIDVEGADIFYFKDGKIATVRAYFDLMIIMTQIGIMQPMTLGGIGVPKKTG